MASDIRRSGRQRKANKKYENDLMEKETLRFLRESSESSRPTSPDTSDPEEPKSDNDFDFTRLDEAQFSADEEDDLSLVSRSGQGLSEGSEIQTPDESDANMSIATSGISEPEDYEGMPGRRDRRHAHRTKAGPHSRGLRPTHKIASRHALWGTLIGPGDEDVLALLFARDQWSSRRDITFPSRKSLEEVARQGIYGNFSRFGISAGDLKHEATAGWNWYDEESGSHFRKTQESDILDYHQARSYITSTTGQTSRIVMGPTKSQKAYEVANLAAMDFGIAWEKLPARPEQLVTDANADTTTGETSDNAPPQSTLHSPRFRYREGWLLNLGAKIQCLAWAPNRNGSDTQYLAVSTSCSAAQRNSVPTSNDRRAPAFRPSPPYPSSIQIWAFCCTPSCEGLQKPDMRGEPRLVQVLCTEWGNIRQLQWCPVLREQRKVPDQHMNEPSVTNLGLLAVMAGDGHARVLDVSVQMSSDPIPQYLSVRSAAFDVSSKSSLYTCLSFVSPTDLLCGTASGFVDLFNIIQINNYPSSTSSPPVPYLTTQQSQTYMLSLTPAYPSPIPDLLASTSMSGTPVLTSLLSPAHSKIPGKSARLASKHLSYSPHLRCLLFTSEGDDVSAYPLRRFFSGVRVARFWGQGTLTALATSRWHPCVLIGTSGGTVSCTNILRRVLPSVKRSRSSGAWVQKLCEYIWVPSPKTENTGTGEENANSNPNPTPQSPDRDHIFHGSDARPGTSRFHEGFKSEKQDLSSMAKLKARRNNTANPDAPAIGTSTNPGRKTQSLGVITETIYHEEQAVTAAEWNPNIECSGWVALGWGSGILRIEDCAHG